MHIDWASAFQKIMKTEEALIPIFVPANDPKAQAIAGAVLVTETLFGQIFGLLPSAAPAAPVAAPAPAPAQ